MRQKIPWYLHPSFAPCRIQNLVGWWNSSSWDGMVWRNLAPSYSDRNHGTLKNGVGIGELIHPSGIFGAGLSFDGSTGYADCGNDNSLNIQNAITIESWVKPAVEDKVIKQVAIKEGSYYFGVGDPDADVNNVVRGGVWFLPSGKDYGVTTVPKDVWSHIAMVFIDNDVIRFYLNGVEDVNYSHSNTIPTSASNLQIGRRQTPKDYFNGTIALVRIYNVALSASDVFHNYTHSPIYYLNKAGIDPMSLLQQPAWQVARSVI